MNFLKLRENYLPGEVMGRPWGQNRPLAEYDAASRKRVHKIVNEKIGILFEKTILRRFFYE